MKNFSTIILFVFFAISTINLKAPESILLGHVPLCNGTTLNVFQESCGKQQRGSDCLVRSIMTAISKSSRAAEILKPKTANEIAELEDVFARRFYKYLFKTGQIKLSEYQKSLNPWHHFALSHFYGGQQAVGFLNFLSKKGICGALVPLESIIVVESVPGIEQIGFNGNLSDQEITKLSYFMRGKTNKIRIILLNSMIYEIIDQKTHRKIKSEMANHWVCVELSRNPVNGQLCATIIDSMILDPRFGSRTIAQLVGTLVNEATKTFIPMRSSSQSGQQSSRERTQTPQKAIISRPILTSQKSGKFISAANPGLRPCLKGSSNSSGSRKNKQQVRFQESLGFEQFCA